MFVRKFESDTIEEALKDIKRELGPDAVILKTITNKGLKGAFKKKKIEITAAVSEKDYVKKAQVDTVLNENQKEEFYGGSAGYISNMIDKHGAHKDNKDNKGDRGYGQMGLNRSVSSAKNTDAQNKKYINQKPNSKSGLDDFLKVNETVSKLDRATIDSFDFDQHVDDSRTKRAPATGASAVHIQSPVNPASNRLMGEEMFEKHKEKIDELEKKLFELTRNFERIHKKEPTGIYKLHTTLKTLGIEESYIQHLIKKGLFELTEEDLDNVDLVFEFALREMMGTVNTALPLYSTVNNQNSQVKSPVITIFLSELSCGQSTMVKKVGSMVKDSVIIKNIVSINQPKSNFAEKILGINVVKTASMAEIVSECKKAIELGKSVFVDYKCTEMESNDTKKFIDGLRRAFFKVEVLITLSAIHSELYNKKVLATYRRLSDGVVVSHLDACLNFGSLFNITQDIKDLPYKFFGTGEIIPDDLEPATAERIMAGIFKL